MTAATRRRSYRRPAPKQEIQRELEWTALIEIALVAPGSTGDTYNRFYSYSFLNQMLLMLQGVQEPVATYRKWAELGRQVRRGEKAKSILRPIIVKRKSEDEDGNETETAFKRFKLVPCLFGVSQTDGDELPPFQAPGWDLPTALTALDVAEVPFSTVDGNVQGYSHGREFAIHPLAVNRTRTTFHELGHILLGHTTDAGMAEYLLHRGQHEFQAETVSFLVLKELGLLDEESASHTRGYIQEWLRGEKPSDAAIRAVFQAVDAILKAGRPTEARGELMTEHKSPINQKAMQWVIRNPTPDNLQDTAADIVFWVNANGGEAWYEPQFDGGSLAHPARIAVRTIKGWAYAKPGDYVIMGETRFRPVSGDLPFYELTREIRVFNVVSDQEPVTLSAAGPHDGGTTMTSLPPEPTMPEFLAEVASVCALVAYGHAQKLPPHLVEALTVLAETAKRWSTGSTPPQASP